MQIPSFPECSHDLVTASNHYSDSDLLTLFQRHPDSGRYFATIFCRYSPLVYSLIGHSVRSPAQAEYLFASTWRHLYHELGGLNLRDRATSDEDKPQTLQNWLIHTTAFCINQMKLPPVEAVHYTLAEASPPLWCYVEQALDRLPPIQRLMVLMAQTFHWSEIRISAYLQAEGETISSGEVKQRLDEAYDALEAALPEDVAIIYLDRIRQPVETDDDLNDFEDIFGVDPLLSLYD